LVFYTNKHGKSAKALRYATLSIVAINDDCHQPLTIGFGINYVGQSRLDVVKKLLGQINLDLKIDFLFMDGGFASVDIVEYLDLQFIPWITRGNYTKKKTYHGKATNPYFFPYCLKREYWVAAYLFEQKLSDGTTETILLFSSILRIMSKAKAKQIYRRRFRIENTYRHARVVKIRTSTRSIQLRWILWAIAHFLELVWEIIKFNL